MGFRLDTEGGAAVYRYLDLHYQHTYLQNGLYTILQNARYKSCRTLILVELSGQQDTLGESCKKQDSWQLRADLWQGIFACFFHNQFWLILYAKQNAGSDTQSIIGSKCYSASSIL